MSSTCESLDLTTCFGPGRLAAFTVDRLVGMEGVQIGDRIVVDIEGRPKANSYLAAQISGEVCVRKCLKGPGGLWLVGPGWVDMRINDSRVHVLGVVRGLVRTYGKSPHLSRSIEPVTNGRKR